MTIYYLDHCHLYFYSNCKIELCQNVCLSLFKELPSVRAAAFNLFGSLARFSDGPSRGPFLEQIQTNFIMLLLHLNEEDPTVVMVGGTIVKLIQEDSLKFCF